MPTLRTTLLALTAAAALGACSKQNQSRVPGTRVANDEINRSIIEAVEAYRIAVENRDPEALVLMASPKYWEDRGTVEPDDDYGYEGLKQALAGRFQLAEDVRYSLRYDNIRRVCPGPGLERGCKAHVEVQIDASYTVADARGAAVRKDKRDQNELVLEYDGSKWLFVSGM